MEFTLETRNTHHWDLHTSTGRIALRGGPDDGCLNYFVRDERDNPTAVFDGEFPTMEIALSVMIAEVTRPTQ